MNLLNLAILVLIIINISLCSYGIYKKVNESYMNGDGPGYKEALMSAFNESKDEGYEVEDTDRLMNKFSGSGEGYQDGQEDVKQNLSSLYGE
jgi:hypothetical protein